MTVALAVIGSTVLATAVVGATTPPPRTVRAALGLDDTDPSGLTIRQASAVARRTAACMAAHRLPYVAAPEPPPAIPDPDLDPIAWAGRWGFGVATSVGLTVAPVLDPNATYAAALGPTDRARYRRVLFGVDGRGGCHGAATTGVYGLRDRALAPLRTAFDALARAIDSDPAMRALRGAWRTCASAATAGLGIAAADHTRDRLPSVLIEAFAAQARSTPSHPGSLEELRQVERAVAAGIARCESVFIDGREVVAGPHEARFVRAHQAELARIGRTIRDAESALPPAPP